MNAPLADLRIPDLGEGVEEGAVIAILVAAGERVAAGQSILELETDKVTLEIPAPRAGTIVEICIAVDAVVRAGDVVLRMADDEVAAASQGPASVVATIAAGATSAVSAVTPCATPLAALPNRGHAVPAGPAARREARQLGVDIGVIQGSGPRGRIVSEDVRLHVRERMQRTPSTNVASAPAELPDLATFGPISRAPLTRLEQATARNLVRSAELIPHAWIEMRVDITALEQARSKIRAQQADDAPRVTLSAVLCKVVALAMHCYPRFNAAFDAATQELVLREYVNVGIAVDTPRGLLVPVIRDVPNFSISEVATELQRLSLAARDNVLAASALQGAGITISNLGAFGVSALQPVVNWPQVAILGVAASMSELTQSGAGIVTRQMLPLTLGFDHRVINGADAARFLSYVASLLGEPLQLAISI